MLRAIVLTFISICISGCSGLLVYQHDNKIHHTILEDGDFNTVKSTAVLVSATANGYRNTSYGVNSDGAITGVCRYKPGKTDFSVFVGRRLVTSLNHDDLAKAVDKFESNTLYKNLIINGDSDNHFGCVEVGASSDGPFLVLRIQPNRYPTPEENPQDVILKLELKGKNLKILDMEKIGRTDSPARIVPISNPGANRISDANGVINIDGSPVLLNGQPISLDEIKTNSYKPIKHHFK